MRRPVDRFAEHKEQVHQALIDAALDRFESVGFEATTVDDIATAAGVSPRTFFRYFPTKDAVLFPDKEERTAAFNAALADRPVDEPVLAALRGAVLSLVDHLSANAEVWRRRRDVLRATPSLLGRDLETQQAFADLITHFAAARLAVDAERDLRPRLIANTIMGALGAAMDTWAASDASADLGALVVEQALTLVTIGPSGIA